MKKTLIATLASVVMVSPVAAQERDPSLVPGIWRPSETVSPLDRKRMVSQTLLSSNELLDVRAQPSVGIFMLKCQDDEIYALISWGGAFFGTSTVDVEWRVDESRIRRETWSVGQGTTDAAMTWAVPPEGCWMPFGTESKWSFVFTDTAAYRTPFSTSAMLLRRWIQ